MCCIFTCCGWMIDLIQRLWTFTMSCCISSAVCCSLLTASMSGVALGYNYSLAEYIDLKETNVSVYLKRGVFDDEVADDMEWRRRGHMPREGLLNDRNLVTGEPDDESTPLRAGRRLDDSILESNDKNSFEGALMKLTAKPPAENKPSPTQSELDMSQIKSEFLSSYGQMDEMKAIKSLINKQKAAEAQRRLQNKQQQSDSGRRMMPQTQPTPPHMNWEKLSTFNSLRLAVPDQGFHAPENWIRKNKDRERYNDNVFDDFSIIATMLTPITDKPKPVRPSRPHRPSRPKAVPSEIKPTLTAPRTANVVSKIIEDNALQDINEKLLFDKFDDPSFRDEELALKSKKVPNQSEEDYEEDVKGIPIRRRRSVRKLNKDNVMSKSNTIQGYINKLLSGSKVSNEENYITTRTTDTTLMKLILSCTS